jgi:hypothetical protein
MLKVLLENIKSQLELQIACLEFEMQESNIDHDSDAYGYLEDLAEYLKDGVEEINGYISVTQNEMKDAA